MLINLIRNAVDAVLESGAQLPSAAADSQPGSEKKGVLVRWQAAADQLAIEIQDDGPGLSNPSNLFTPFYTTKPHGSGVGLVLCRQIAEAHGGTIEIRNRVNAPGCLVRVLLPLTANSPVQRYR